MLGEAKKGGIVFYVKRGERFGSRIPSQITLGMQSTEAAESWSWALLQQIHSGLKSQNSGLKTVGSDSAIKTMSQDSGFKTVGSR